MILDCGDVTDIAVGNGVFGADSECNEVCPGDPLHICGDGNRLTTYFWNKTGVAPLTTWHTPANTGFYEVSFIFFEKCERRWQRMYNIYGAAPAFSDARCAAM